MEWMQHEHAGPLIEQLEGFCMHIHWSSTAAVLAPIELEANLPDALLPTTICVLTCAVTALCELMSFAAKSPKDAYACL